MTIFEILQISKIICSRTALGLLAGLQTGRGDVFERESLEAKSCLIPFDPVLRPVFWFNDEFPPHTWSKLHSHPHWGELAYSGRGCIVMCTEQGNYPAPPQRAVWAPAGVPLPGPATAEAAIATAHAAYKAWRNLSLAKRMAFIYKIHHCMQRDLEKLAQAIALDQAKHISEARGEVQR